jgi:hypothetical protein
VKKQFFASAGIAWSISACLLVLLLVALFLPGTTAIPSEAPLVNPQSHDAVEDPLLLTASGSVSAAPATPPANPLVNRPGPKVSVLFDPSAMRRTPNGVISRRAFLARQVEHNFGGFIDSLNTSVEKKVALRKFMVERATTLQDLREMTTFNEVTQPEQIGKLKDDAIAEIKPNIDDILDPQSASTFREMLKVEASFTDISNTVALDMVSAGVPLTSDQKIKLATEMSAANYSPIAKGNEKMAALIGVAAVAPPNKEALWTSAAKILSKDQFLVFNESDRVKDAQDGLALDALQKAIESAPAGLAPPQVPPAK